MAVIFITSYGKADSKCNHIKKLLESGCENLIMQNFFIHPPGNMDNDTGKFNYLGVSKRRLDKSVDSSQGEIRTEEISL